MAEIKAAVNSPHTSAWVAPIGKLVLNFAAIEMHTYLWIGDFAKDDKLISRVVDWPFKRRVDHLLPLLKAQIKGAGLRDECVGTWNRTLDIAMTRNALVHNPIVFGWTGEEGKGPPDIIGIPDVGHLSTKPKLSKRIATVEDINSFVNETARLGKHLFALRAKYYPAL